MARQIGATMILGSSTPPRARRRPMVAPSRRTRLAADRGAERVKLFA
jgi:hypothetical protein